MANASSAPLAALKRGLERATELAVAGRYADLALEATALERQASALQGLKEALVAGGIQPAAWRDACRELKRRTSLLHEVLRHVTVVQAGLLQVGDAARQAYDRDGRFAAASGVRFYEEA